MIYFLYGDTAPLQIKYEEVLSDIKGNNPKIPTNIFDAYADDIQDFFNAISTNSMFVTKELIVLKRAETIKNFDNFIKSISMYNFSQKELIIIYEEILNDFGKITNEIGKKTLSSLEEIAKVICYRKVNEEKAVVFLIQKELNISEAEAKELSDKIGNDYFKIKNEIDKIKNFLDGDTYSFDKIKNIIIISNENNLKNLIEELLKNKKSKELIEYLQTTKSYNLFISIINDELIQLLKLKLLLENRIIRQNMIYKEFNEKVFPKISNYFIKNGRTPHPYSIFVKLNFNISLTSEEIKTALKNLLNIEYNYKRGFSNVETDIELFIIKLCS